MRKLFLFLIVFILTGFASCNKPQENDPDPIPIDTIFPLPYYPVYPGSYWKYIDSNGDTTVIMTTPEYRKDWYRMEEELDPDTAYVPCQINARDTSIEISGRIYFPTIIINEYFIHSDVYGRKMYERCYTKGIGLVKEEVFNNFGQLVNTKILLDYYINH